MKGMILFVGATTILLLLFLTACETISRGPDPAPGQVALQATLQALQGTVIALESRNQAGQPPPVVPSPQIIVVTATPSDTPMPNPTPTATAPAPATVTPQPPATSTPLPSPTLAPVLTQPPTPLIVVVTATPTPLAPLYRYETRPILTEPRSEAVVEEQRQILLRWSWNGLLGPNEHFDLKIRPDGQNRSVYVAWAEAEAYDLQANLAPGRYLWSVQVIRGYYQNDSGRPEDRVFETFLSPESEPRLLIVTKKPDKNPVSVSQAEPPAANVPVGIVVGGGAFIALLALTPKRGHFG